MYGLFFTMPAASQIIASSSEYSSPVVSDFMPFIFLVLGFTLAFAAIAVIIYSVGGATKH